LHWRECGSHPPHHPPVVVGGVLERKTDERDHSPGLGVAAFAEEKLPLRNSIAQQHWHHDDWHDYWVVHRRMVVNLLLRLFLHTWLVVVPIDGYSRRRTAWWIVYTVQYYQ
jgi:hypothetical protein